MKRLLLTFAFALFALQGFAFAQTTDYKLNQFYPSDFNTWTAVGTNTLSGTGSKTVIVSGPTAVITANGGTRFNPFVTNDTLIVDTGTANQETVTITGTSCNPPGTCSFTASFSNAHTARYNLNSGTYGLQEAVNAAAASSNGGVVWVQPSYPGTTSMITGLVAGNANVLVVDRRAGAWTPYVWSGSAYVASFINGQGANGTQVQILTKTTTIAGAAGATITASNFIPAGSLVLGLSSYVVSTFSNTSLTSMKIGDGTTTNQFSSATMALTAGTTSNSVTDGANTAPPFYKVATSVVVTGNGASFAANGSIRIVLFYITITAPTS